MERISNEKRLEILDAAIKLFSEQGFEKTTVDEIAGQAGVGKGTIYLYFNTKEQIFLAIIEDGLKALNRMVSEILSGPGDYFQHIERVIRANFQFVEKNRDFSKIIIKEQLNLKLFNADPGCRNIVEAQKSLHLVLQKYFDQGIQAGYFREGDPYQYTLAFGGIISHFTFHWIKEGGAEPLSDQAGNILDIFLNGVKKHE